MNRLSPYKIPYGRYLKSGEYRPPGKNSIKWFSEPMRTILVTREGEYQNIKYEPFNPGSRAHIVKWMREEHNYEFPYYTDKGSPKVDVDSLENMEHSSGEKLKRYLKVVKDQSQLEGAEGAILKNVRKDSTVTSRVDTCGTVTGRFTSSKINLNQIPAQQEFRELFSAPKGWTFLGSDFDGQENVILAELLLPYDNGRLRDIIVSGDKSKGTDLHSINAKACNVTRSQSKPLWFGFLFGSSSTLTGYTLLGNDTYTNFTDDEFKKMDKKLKRRVISIEDEDFYPIKKGTLIPYNRHVVVQAIFGKHVQDKLVQSTTGLENLINDLKKEAKDKGYLTMPGGRQVQIRHEHAALNTATQGGGGEAMKVFLITVMERAKSLGLIHGVHFKLQATIYDETDYIVRNDKIDLLKKAIEGSYEITSRKLGMSCTFTGEVLTGPNWWTCH